MWANGGTEVRTILLPSLSTKKLFTADAHTQSWDDLGIFLSGHIILAYFLLTWDMVARNHKITEENF